jgi:hypothetical protein
MDYISVFVSSYYEVTKIVLHENDTLLPISAQLWCKSFRSLDERRQSSGK